MYPITEAVKALFEAEQRKVLRITGTDKNGTAINITDDNVMEDSFQIDRYSCNGEKLEVGTAIAAQMSFTLENGDGTYDGIVFEDTELFAEVGVADWTQANPTIHWVPCGYFTPDMQPRRLSTISVTALDRMTKFDVVVDAADLTFPATIAGLVSQVCTLCGVTLAQSISGLVNASVAVTELPTVQGEITYRNLIQWCAGIMGTNAWFDWNGQLRFSWYNNVTGYVSTMDNRYSSDLYEDDLTITGVEYTNDSGIAVVDGTDDYAIDLTGNAIAGPLIATVLPPLNTALNGFTYRPFTAAVVNAPYLWPMDIVTFTDKTGNNHTSVLTNVAFGLDGTTAMESKGMTYAINKLAQPKGFTREQAQLVNQAMKHVEQDIDDSLTQQEIFNRLTDNGAAQGLVLYDGQLYINASYINAGFLNVGRISFNEPDRYYDVPNENDPNSLLSGQTVVDGWIVNTSGGDYITVFSCGFAIPLRGKTITVTFAFNGTLSGGENSWTSISDDALEMGAFQDWVMPSGTTPPNPYTYSVAVPDDAMSFSIAMECAGVKQIEVSLDSPVTPSESIVYNYEGLRLGEGNTKFQVYRDGTLITTGKSLFNDPVRMNWLYLNTPLDVASGGTGARNAASARANLGITPANIGAKPTQTAVADPTASGTAVAFIDSVTQNADGVITPTKKTVRSASQSESGLMSATDKGKLDGIAAGAQVNSLTGVKGNAESSYRQGNVNLTPANIGAVAKSGDTMTGNLTIKNPTANTNTQISVQTTQNSGAVTIRVDQEGGNIIIVSPNGKEFQIDAYSDNTIRVYSYDDSSPAVIKSVTFNRLTGALSATGGFSGNATNVTGTVAVTHGGTGATNAASARANLGITPANIGAAANIMLGSGDTTPSTIYNKVKVLSYANRDGALIHIDQAALNVLTNRTNFTGAYSGLITHTASNTYRFLLTNGGSTMICFYASITSSAITPGNIYRYSGTLMS